MIYFDSNICMVTYSYIHLDFLQNEDDFILNRIKSCSRYGISSEYPKISSHMSRQSLCFLATHVTFRNMSCYITYTCIRKIGRKILHGQLLFLAAEA